MIRISILSNSRNNPLSFSEMPTNSILKVIWSTWRKSVEKKLFPPSKPWFRSINKRYIVFYSEMETKILRNLKLQRSSVKENWNGWTKYAIICFHDGYDVNLLHDWYVRQHCRWWWITYHVIHLSLHTQILWWTYCRFWTSLGHWLNCQNQWS